MICDIARSPVFRISTERVQHRLALAAFPHLGGNLFAFKLLVGVPAVKPVRKPINHAVEEHHDRREHHAIGEPFSVFINHTGIDVAARLQIRFKDEGRTQIGRRNV